MRRVAIATAFAFIVVGADLVLPVAPDHLVGWDTRVYWSALAATDPYAASQLGVLGSYLYSPAVLTLLAPLGVLGWHGFLFVWTGVLSLAGLWLIEEVHPAIRRWWPLLAVLAIGDIWGGNIHVLLGLGIVLAFRSPTAWAVPVLTKVTPSIGLLWLVARREWASLGLAIVAVAVVVGISMVADPTLWPAWVSMLVSQERPVGFAVPIPLPLRLAAVVPLIAWAATTERRWLLVVAAWLALPAIWPTSAAMLLGAAALWEPRPALAGASDPWISRLRVLAASVQAFRTRRARHVSSRG
jgi:hypothetical protein